MEVVALNRSSHTAHFPLCPVSHCRSIEALYQEYLGTPSQFTKLNLPPPNQTCIDARISREDRCSGDIDTMRGDAYGACEYPPISLQRLISTGLYHATLGDGASDTPTALQNPSYEAISNFRITHLQLNQILGYWLERGTDKWNFDPRDAACRWVVENFDSLKETFIPRDYPRVIVDKVGDKEGSTDGT